MSNLLEPNRRILIVDDNPAIHDDFKRVLWRDDSKARDLDADAAALFGYEEGSADFREIHFDLDSAHQGQEALEKVEEALAEGRPYAMAFVDMRMPPGWDGLKTIKEIWKVDNSIQTVICTAYSDKSWKEIQDTLTDRDRWMVVKKPFDQIEVLQLAHALTTKWDLKKAAELREDGLEQIVKARTEQLSAALQTNSDFLNHVSHEMLTPMNGILGYLDLLCEPCSEEEEAEYVLEAKGCGEDLLRLINQILAYNEAGADEMKPLTTSVNLHHWLPGVANDAIQEQAREKGLNFSVSVAADIQNLYHMPENIVGRVLTILVENAIKFTQSGTISLSVEPSDRGASDLLFKVSDTGVGLSEEQLKLINIPFAQIDSSYSRSNDGIGIGLPLARRLLSLIGSNLKFESTGVDGSCVSFYVTSVVGMAIDQAI